MINKSETYVVIGKPIPYNDGDSPVPLAVITVMADTVMLEMDSFFANSKTLAFEIWEHTIYEFETLFIALRHAARHQFPQSLELPINSSWISERRDLTLVAECEVGYSIASPSSNRSTFYCSSQEWGEGLGVKVGVALGGAFGEVVMEPHQANALANWLEGQLDRFR